MMGVDCWIDRHSDIIGRIQITQRDALPYYSAQGGLRVKNLTYGGLISGLSTLIQVIWALHNVLCQDAHTLPGTS